MDWEAPHYIEIDMNAEIGAYQQDGAPGPEKRPEHETVHAATEAERGLDRRAPRSGG